MVRSLACQILVARASDATVKGETQRDFVCRFRCWFLATLFRPTLFGGLQAGIQPRGTYLVGIRKPLFPGNIL